MQHKVRLKEFLLRYLVTSGVLSHMPECVLVPGVNGSLLFNCMVTFHGFDNVSLRSFM